METTAIATKLVFFFLQLLYNHCMLLRLGVPFFWFVTKNQVSSGSLAARLLNMGPICCPEISVNNYQHSLHNSQEEGRPHLQRGGSLTCCLKLFLLVRPEEGSSSKFKGRARFPWRRQLYFCSWSGDRQ